MLNEEETLRLIAEAKKGDREAKEKLTQENYNLLKCVARRYMGKGVEFDDLMQLAAIGYLKAIAGFEPKYGVKLSTYAVPMIAGEIKRFMRDDGAIKVSRALKRTYREMNAYSEQFFLEHQRQPTIRELSEYFHIEESEVVLALDSAKMPVSIFEQGEYKDEKTPTLLDRMPVKDDQDFMIEKMELKSAIEALPKRERKIIYLRYFHDMTQSEVARVVGVSQVQISRLENKIMDGFRKRLG